MEPDRFSWRARGRSFIYAFDGLIYFFRWGHNARIHGIAAIIALALALFLHFSPLEMIAVCAVIGLVWMAELFNTAVEKIMDHLSPARHPDVKVIKDLAAAAVLVTAFVAAITGLYLFIPKIL